MILFKDIRFVLITLEIHAELMRPVFHQWCLAVSHVVSTEGTLRNLGSRLKEITQSSTRRSTILGNWGEIIPHIITTGWVVALLKSSWGCGRHKVACKTVVGSHHKQGTLPTGMPEKILAKRPREIIIILYMVPLLARLQLWCCAQFWLPRN